MDASLLKQNPEVISGAMCSSESGAPILKLFNYLESSSQYKVCLKTSRSFPRAGSCAA